MGTRIEPSALFRTPLLSSDSSSAPAPAAPRPAPAQRLAFVFHEGTESLFARLIDQNTGAVVKEMPPQADLDIRARRREAIDRLVDRRV